MKPVQIKDESTSIYKQNQQGLRCIKCDTAVPKFNDFKYYIYAHCIVCNCRTRFIRSVLSEQELKEYYERKAQKRKNDEKELCERHPRLREALLRRNREDE